MNKRVTSLILVVVMVCTMLASAVSVFAVPTDSGVSASAAEVSPGDTFTVTFKVPGTEKQISDLSLKVLFDNTAFEVIEFSTINIAGMSKVQSTVSEANEKAFFAALYSSLTYDADVSFEGIELTATFRVKNSALEKDYAFLIDPSVCVGSLDDSGCPDILYSYNDFSVKSTTVTVTIPPCHVEETVPGKAATCTEDGLTDGKKCAICGEVLIAQDVIPAKGHSYTSEVTTQATCTSSGIEAFTCSVCGDSFTKVLPAAGHSYSSLVTAPTCTAQGYTTHTCQTCGYSYKDSYVDAAGHTEQILPGKAPTNIDTGLTEGVKCSVCGEILIPQAVIPATGFTVSGIVISFGDDTDDVTIQLIASGTSEVIYEVVIQGNSTAYAIPGVVSGTYTMRVIKAKHAVREYTVSVDASAVTKDAEIWLYGDVTGDGQINATDSTQINRIFSGKVSIFSSGDDETRAYRFIVANVYTADDLINATDSTQLKRHFGGKASVLASIQ